MYSPVVIGSSANINTKSSVPSSITKELFGLFEYILLTVASLVELPLQVVHIPPSCPATKPPTVRSSKNSQLAVPMFTISEFEQIDSPSS